MFATSTESRTMLRKIDGITGTAFALITPNLDTDRIIPARYLKCVTFEGLGEHVFEDDRRQQAGAHPFDLPRNKGRDILVVGENFGSGSSREHAVPALMQWGIQAVIGLSFAEIFRGNAVGNGLICVTVPPERHNDLLVCNEQSNNIIGIDLRAMKVKIGTPGQSAEMDCMMPGSHREMFLSGEWDDIATCLDAGSDIERVAATLPYFRKQAA